MPQVRKNYFHYLRADIKHKWSFEKIEPPNGSLNEKKINHHATLLIIYKI